MEWFTINRKKTDLFTEVKNYINEENIIFHIGTDAQAVSNDEADFVTVVCVHAIDVETRMLVSRILYWKDKKVATHSLWEKLYGETERSLRIAVLLTEEFGPDIVDKILVHVDANPDTRWASSNYVKQLAGMVLGYGFKYVLKPDAFVASHAADHIVKNKN